MGRDALLHAVGLPARGHLLAPRAGRPAGLLHPAVLPDRPGLLREPGRPVPLLRRPQLVFSEQGAKQLLANATFTHYLFPGTSSSLNVNGALWTLTIEMLLYAFLPMMALLVRFNPWLGTAILIAIGLGWRAWVAFDGDWLRELLLRGQPVQPRHREPVHRPAVHRARRRSSRSASWPAGWSCTATSTGSTRGCPARLGVSSFLVLMLPSIALLYWVESGTHYTNRVLFTVYDFVVMLVLVPALLLAARPQRFSPSPLRSVEHVAGRAQLQHLPVALPDHPGHRTSAARSAAPARRRATGGGCPRSWSSHWSSPP